MNNAMLSLSTRSEFQNYRNMYCVSVGRGGGWCACACTRINTLASDICSTFPALIVGGGGGGGGPIFLNNTRYFNLLTPPPPIPICEMLEICQHAPNLLRLQKICCHRLIFMGIVFFIHEKASM